MLLNNITTLFADIWRSVIEIILLAVINYRIYLALHRSRHSKIIILIIILLLLASLTSQFFKLEVMYWVLKNFTLVIILSMIVIFQQEIRRMLIHIGTNKLFYFGDFKTDIVTDIIDCIDILSKKRHGALIAIERKTSLKYYADTGVPLDSIFGIEILNTIFYPKSPLHDGGVIIQGQRILAAACIFPVSQKELNDKTIGLRHRAGLGITEETDAFIIITSEETGNITTCINGEMNRNISKKKLKSQLEELVIENV